MMRRTPLFLTSVAISPPTAPRVAASSGWSRRAPARLP
jgi:hypothetical protein